MTQAPDGGPHYATLRDYLDVLRRHRLLVVVVVALGVGAAVLYSSRQDPVYEAQASLSFREPTQDVELIGLPPIQYMTPVERAAVGAEQAQTRKVLTAAQKDLRTPLTVEQIDEDVSARSEVNTNLVVVEGRASTARGAALLTNAVAKATRDIYTRDQRRRYQRLVERTLAERKKAIKGNSKEARDERRQLEAELVPVRTARALTRPVELVQPATPPSSPSSPKPVRNALIGGAAGLLLSLLLVTLRTVLDRRLRDPNEISQLAGSPVLTSIRDEALGQVNLGGQDEEAERDLEAFRVLRTNLDYLDIDSKVKTVLITSPLPSEGKSTVAASLAVAQAIGNRRTLLVECDLRRPVLADRWGTDRTPGLTDYLVGHAEPQDIVRTMPLPVTSANGNGEPAADGMPVPTVAVIPAGSAAPRPAELLDSERFATFLREVSEVYDVVILDSPPLLPVGDTLELVQGVDAVVLCVRAHQTTRDDVRAALRALDKLPQRPRGIVVTGLRKPDESYGYYYGSYAYSSKG